MLFTSTNQSVNPEDLFALARKVGKRFGSKWDKKRNRHSNRCFRYRDTQIKLRMRSGTGIASQRKAELGKEIYPMIERNLKNIKLIIQRIIHW